MAESEEEIKSLLMKVKEESDGIRSHHFVAIEGEIVETVADFIFLGCRITADGDCSHEIKGRLLLGRKVMTNLENVLKCRDITLPTNSF